MDIGKHQLSAGDIVSNTFRGWFDNFGPVFVVSALFTVPIFIVNAIVVAGLPDLPEDIDDFELGPFLARSLGGNFITIVLGLLLTAALSYTFLRIYRGEAVNPQETANAVRDNIVAIVVFAVIAAVLTAIGFILLIIPGVLAIIVFSLGPPAILNERINGISAISRSIQLMSGNWGTALGVVLVGFLINIGASVVLGGIAVPGALAYPSFSDFSAIRALVQITASAVVAPVIPGLATALYFEFRGRNEGFPTT
jgi:hypothetical protein